MQIIKTYVGYFLFLLHRVDLLQLLKKNLKKFSFNYLFFDHTTFLSSITSFNRRLGVQ